MTTMRIGKLMAGLVGALAAAPTYAQTQLEEVGVPVPGGIGFQPAVTDLAEDLQWLDGFLLIIITVIVLFVSGLMLYAFRNFQIDKNPTPATFTHNSTIEVVWTVVPVVILVIIAIPSLQLLDKQVTVPEASITIKATGNQWYWTYEYPDEEFSFDAYMVGYGYKDFETAMENDREAMEAAGVTKENYRLVTDTAVVVPVGQVVRMQVTASDVIHSWTIPAFGVKMDGIPGRLNETWFRVGPSYEDFDDPDAYEAALKAAEGIYYGQCSELCGKDHSYMPITVKAVSLEAYKIWLEEAEALYAGRGPTISVAALD
ncbi:MAG: cytochrome c oxidase subunit II transmembrane domain-containing protein [Pseudomonadota bacterium]